MTNYISYRKLEWYFFFVSLSQGSENSINPCQDLWHFCLLAGTWPPNLTVALWHGSHLRCPGGILVNRMGRGWERKWLVGGLEHQFYFPIYWVANHPNWLSYFSEGLKPPTRKVGKDVEFQRQDLRCCRKKGLYFNRKQLGFEQQPALWNPAIWCVEIRCGLVPNRWILKLCLISVWLWGSPRDYADLLVYVGFIIVNLQTRWVKIWHLRKWMGAHVTR